MTSCRSRLDLYLDQGVTCVTFWFRTCYGLLVLLCLEAHTVSYLEEKNTFSVQQSNNFDTISFSNVLKLPYSVL